MLKTPLIVYVRLPGQVLVHLAKGMGRSPKKATQAAWTRLYEGRDIQKPDPAAGEGVQVELGKLTEEGVKNLRAFVDNYDNKNFDVTGVLADNCAQFSLAVADKALGLEVEKEVGRHDTSASAGAKMEAAAHKMQQSTSRDRYPFLQKP